MKRFGSFVALGLNRERKKYQIEKRKEMEKNENSERIENVRRRRDTLNFSTSLTIKI